MFARSYQMWKLNQKKNYFVKFEPEWIFLAPRQFFSCAEFYIKIWVNFLKTSLSEIRKSPDIPKSNSEGDICTEKLKLIGPFFARRSTDNDVTLWKNVFYFCAVGVDSWVKTALKLILWKTLFRYQLHIFLLVL